MDESGMPHVQMKRERARTLNQHRLLPKVMRDSSFLNVRIDPAMPLRKPIDCRPVCSHPAMANYDWLKDVSFDWYDFIIIEGAFYVTSQIMKHRKHPS